MVKFFLQSSLVCPNIGPHRVLPARICFESHSGHGYCKKEKPPSQTCHCVLPFYFRPVRLPLEQLGGFACLGPVPTPLPITESTGIGVF